MRQNRHGWFEAREWIRCMQEVSKKIARKPSNWLNHPNCMYLSFRVDQRTGAFIILDGDGQRVTNEALYDMFPTLAQNMLTIEEIQRMRARAGLLPIPTDIVNQ